jgi:hypothetical protein
MVAHQMVAALRGHRQVDRQTPRQPAASICGSSWSSRPGPIIAPHRRRPARAPTAGRARYPGPLLGGAAAAVPPLCGSSSAQAHHRRRGGRRRPRACRDPVGRDAGLTCMPPAPGRSPIGATAPASPRTRRGTAEAGKIPATLLSRPGRRDASSLGPRPAHSRLAVPTREHQRGGPPIHAAPTRSWPPAARPLPGPPAQRGNTRSRSPAAPTDGAVP